MTTYRVSVAFTEPILGTAPLNKQIYADYIASNAPTENGQEEVETINEDKGKTGFHRNCDGVPALYDYVIRGFFKDACGMLRRDTKSKSAKLTAYKRIIDGLVFVEPRMIPFSMSGEMDVLVRPLRAQTAQGERVALAHSEMIPTGSSVEFDVVVLDDKSVGRELLEEWLNYGRYRGLGQWRNGSYGRFSYGIAEV